MYSRRSRLANSIILHSFAAVQYFQTVIFLYFYSENPQEGKKVFLDICIVVVYVGGPKNVEKKVFFRVVSISRSRIFGKKVFFRGLAREARENFGIWQYMASEKNFFFVDVLQQQCDSDQIYQKKFFFVQYRNFQKIHEKQHVSTKNFFSFLCCTIWGFLLKINMGIFVET